jgi:proton-translocating NADH-quinone oxidoreductase chain N
MSFTQIFSNHFVAVVPELFLALAISVVLVYSVAYSTSVNFGLPVIVHITGWVSIYILFLTILLILNEPTGPLSLFYNSLIQDYFTCITKVALLSATILCILVSFGYIREEKINAFEYSILTLLAVLGMLLLISSYNLISMYLAIELQSLCLYVLAAFKKRSAFSTEAGLKYFILGALSSGILLFGSSLIYGFTGTTSFEEISKICTGLAELDNVRYNGLLIGMCFVAAGTLFKIAAVPFHMWSPDVYEGAPTVVSTFFAVVPKIALLALFLRLFLFSFYDLVNAWQYIILLCSFGSMLIGAFGALQQRKIKRLLAYSSIGHVGYLLVGVSTGTTEGIQGLLVYILLYMVMSLCIWTSLLSLSFRTKEGRVKYLTDFVGLSKVNPLLAITIALTMFSMAGVPPLAGFFSKLYVFFAAIDASLYLIVTVGVLTSCIGAYYYLRLVKVMFFEKTNIWTLYKPIDREKSLVLGVTFFCILFFFLYPNPLLITTHNMALVLCQ